MPRARRLPHDRYRQFASGLLDVTDNQVGGKVVNPPEVVRHDADDPYLVVELLAFIRTAAGPEVQGRTFVDARPILDREVGARAGIGWFGKNTNLLSMRLGSFFVLGELFLSVPLEPDRPLRDRCGQCRLCLDACPTHAFVGPSVLDAQKCISYLTIELKGAIPRDLRPLMGAHVFGCDICQDVCPYNAKCRPTAEAAFRPRAGLFAPELIPLLRLTEEQFHATFRSVIAGREVGS